jgi:hypothetical protein
MKKGREAARPSELDEMKIHQQGAVDDNTCVAKRDGKEEAQIDSALAMLILSNNAKDASESTSYGLPSSRFTPTPCSPARQTRLGALMTYH